LRRPDYNGGEFKAWVNQVQEQGWRDAFVFFKHEDEGKEPRMAQRYLALIGSRSRVPSGGSRSNSGVRPYSMISIWFGNGLVFGSFYGEAQTSTIDRTSA
jgi:hypothetical protein